MKKSYFFLALILVIGAAAFITPAFNPSWLDSLINWAVIATVLVMLTIVAFFFEFETAAMTSKEIALVAMLGTISAVLRVPFAAVPGVQPCTYLIICTGYVFGPVAGFTVGAITALVSNLFLGQGPWTLYQMIAWGLAGVSASYLNRFNMNRALLIAFGLLWGYLYGWITNLWFWTAFIHPLNLTTFVVTQVGTIWFDTFHAIGNAVFMGFLGMKTVAVLRRFERRFAVEYLVR